MNVSLGCVECFLWGFAAGFAGALQTANISLGFRCRVSGFGFRDSGSGFRVSGSGFRDSGSGSRVSGSGFRVSGFGIRVSEFGFRVPGSEFRVTGFGSRVYREDPDDLDAREGPLEEKPLVHAVPVRYLIVSLGVRF